MEEVLHSDMRIKLTITLSYLKIHIWQDSLGLIAQNVMLVIETIIVMEVMQLECFLQQLVDKLSLLRNLL